MIRLGQAPNIPGLVPSNPTENYRLSVVGSIVSWLNIDGEMRRVFDFRHEGEDITLVLLARLASFKILQAVNEPGNEEKGENDWKGPPTLFLVVVLEHVMHLIDLEGSAGFSLVRVPFPLAAIWPSPNGLVFERDTEMVGLAHLPRHFTLSGSLDEYGIVGLADKHRNLDPEEKILFMGNQCPALCVTRNLLTSTIKIWNCMEFKRLGMTKTSSTRRTTNVILPESHLKHPQHRSSIRAPTLTYDDRMSFLDFDRWASFPIDQFDELNVELTLLEIHTLSLNDDCSTVRVRVIDFDGGTFKVFIIRESAVMVYTLQYLPTSCTFLVKSSSQTEILDCCPCKLFHSYGMLELRSDFSLHISVSTSSQTIKLDRDILSIEEVARNRYDITRTNGMKEHVCVNFSPSSYIVWVCFDAIHKTLSSQISDRITLLWVLLRSQSRSDEWSIFSLIMKLLFSPGLMSNFHECDQNAWEQLMYEENNCVKTDYRDFTPQITALVSELVGEIISYDPKVSAYVHMVLHLVSEDFRVDVATSSLNDHLIPLLIQFCYWLDWKAHLDYYLLSKRSFINHLYDKVSLKLEIPENFGKGHSVYETLISISLGHDAIQYFHLGKVANAIPWNSSNKIISSRPPSCGETLVNVFKNLKNSTTIEHALEVLQRFKITPNQLQRFPPGIAYFIQFFYRHATTEVSTIKAPISEDLLHLLGRKDLLMWLRGYQTATDEKPINPVDESLTVTSIYKHTRDNDGTMNDFKTDSNDSQNITQSIFDKDRRWNEVKILLEYTKTTDFYYILPPNITEHEQVRLQQSAAESLALRALAIPTGSALISFGSKIPLTTERFELPNFEFSFRIKPANTVINVEKSFLKDEMINWGNFHKGVATALAISKKAEHLDKSWILFNRPKEPNPGHAGFLLGLGLNGHLKPLLSWQAFNYLASKDTLTSIALLIGLAASHIGKMNSTIMRLLSVHVISMLPPGSAELNISDLTQASGILGIGLLYLATQHRRTTELMLAELRRVEQPITSPSCPHPGQRDECDRLAAGFALGLLNLGKGKDLRGLKDLHLPEELTAIPSHGFSATDSYIASVAAPGAIMALALIFMKTMDSTIALALELPKTIELSAYIRPDLQLLLIIAKNLIMWDTIEPTLDWVVSQLPPFLESYAEFLGHLDAFAAPFYCIVAGACMAMGLRFAGSFDDKAKSVLLKWHDDFTRILNTVDAVSHEQKICRASLLTCLDTVSIAVSMVMAGTGDLDVFRRLRVLHARREEDIVYGSHMATHMAIGILFLSGGQATFGTSDLAVASLMIAFFPQFPMYPSDNRMHLQAFRHLWVLAVEKRCVVTKNEDTLQVCKTDVIVHGPSFESGCMKLTSPCLIPALNQIQKIEIQAYGLPRTILHVSNKWVHQRLQDSLTFYISSNISAFFNPCNISDEIRKQRVKISQSRKWVSTQNVQTPGISSAYSMDLLWQKFDNDLKESDSVNDILDIKLFLASVAAHPLKIHGTDKEIEDLVNMIKYKLWQLRGRVS